MARLAIQRGPVAERPRWSKNGQCARGEPLDPLRANLNAVALYHLHLKNISRRTGASAVAAAAYRAGEKLWNEAEERESHFGGRRSVRFAQIMTPEGAPAWTGDRATLWNQVERAEKRRDARLAKEIEVALPRELDPSAQRELVEAFGETLASLGLVVDLAIHDDGDNHNPHAHLMLTTRELGADGFGKKIRGVDAPEFLEKIRALWAKLTNAALGRVGAATTIDHRSHAARGIDRQPGQHRGIDRAERRSKQEARLQAGRMIDQPTAGIRLAMQNEPAIQRQFSRLAAREDWPPATREPPRDMGPDERAEHRLFWREVDRRQYLSERGEIAREPERQTEDLETPSRQEPSAQQVARVAEAVERETMPDLSNTALRQLAELQENVMAAWAERGVTGDNVIDLSRLNADLAEFRQTLFEIRMREISRFDQERSEERMQPVPGPDRELVPQGEQDDAQKRMLEEMERKAPRESQQAPTSDVQRILRDLDNQGRASRPDSAREAAQKELLRDMHRERDDERER